MRKGLLASIVFVGLGLATSLLVAQFLASRHIGSMLVFSVSIMPVLLHVAAVVFKTKRLKLLLGSIAVTYLLLELTVYLLLCFDVLRPDVASIMGDNYGATNRRYVQYDSISGYKYLPGTTHLVNIQQHEVVNEVQLHINQQGYCSVNAFSPRKTDNTVKRLMVFGDSYSAGEIVDTAWPDLANKQLQRAGAKTELYNFGLEAAGISNWHRIFFKEVVPGYDFDGIVLAVFGDINYYSSDLARDFAIKHSGVEWSGLNFFETLPKNDLDFREHYETKLFFDSDIYPDSLLNHYRELALKRPTKRNIGLVPFKPYLLNYLADAIGFMRRKAAFRKRYDNRNVDGSYTKMDFSNMDEVEAYYGPQKSQLLKEMLQYCNAHGKEVWLVGIPSFDLASMDSAAYRNNLYTRQLQTIAKTYGSRFIDGASIIAHMPAKQYPDYHLKYDSHWNRAGVDLFVPFFVQQYLLLKTETVDTVTGH